MLDLGVLLYYSVIQAVYLIAVVFLNVGGIVDFEFGMKFLYFFDQILNFLVVQFLLFEHIALETIYNIFCTIQLLLQLLVESFYGRIFLRAYFLAKTVAQLPNTLDLDGELGWNRVIN